MTKIGRIFGVLPDPGLRPHHWERQRKVVSQPGDSAQGFRLWSVETLILPFSIRVWNCMVCSGAFENSLRFIMRIPVKVGGSEWKSLFAILAQIFRQQEVHSSRGWPEWPWECSAVRTRWTTTGWGHEREHRHLPQDSCPHSAPYRAPLAARLTRAPPCPSISRSLVPTKMRVIQALPEAISNRHQIFLAGEWFANDAH